MPTLHPLRARARAKAGVAEVWRAAEGSNLTVRWFINWDGWLRLEELVTKKTKMAIILTVL